LIASETVAEHVNEQDLSLGRIYPPLSEIREVSIKIAVKILEYAYKESECWLYSIGKGVTNCFLLGIATVYPKPKDLRRYVEEQQYNYNYEPSLPNLWPWPKAPYIKTKPMEPTKLKA